MRQESIGVVPTGCATSISVATTAIFSLKKRHGRTRVIANNFEKYMSIQVGRVIFVDSFQFTLSSLDSFANTMDNEDFVSVKKEFTSVVVGEESPHCHNYGEDESTCSLCLENEKVRVHQRAFGSEVSTDHCHNYKRRRIVTCVR